MDAMTRGFNDRVAGSFALAKWGTQATRRINRDGGTPDFVVGRPGARQEIVEDGGRTLVLPLPEDAPRCYAALNETGGITLMMAEEY